jgi:hypothetical protein
MMLQVHADGTVLAAEGVHRVGADLMRPLHAALQEGEVFQPRTHCGGPATDFIEQNVFTVYRRSLGRMQSNTFSCSGNMSGCDAAVRRLNEALDAIQNKLSAPATVAAAGMGEAGRSTITSTAVSGSQPPIPLSTIPTLPATER